MPDTTTPAEPQPRITYEHPRYGLYSAPAMLVDLMAERHLPASPQQLQHLLAATAPEADWSGVHDVIGALVILAEWEEGRQQFTALMEGA